jgi:hypothetical protein
MFYVDLFNIEIYLKFMEFKLNLIEDFFFLMFIILFKLVKLSHFKDNILCYLLLYR